MQSIKCKIRCAAKHTITFIIKVFQNLMRQKLAIKYKCTYILTYFWQRTYTDLVNLIFIDLFDIHKCRPEYINVCIIKTNGIKENLLIVLCADNMSVS